MEDKDYQDPPWLVAVASLLVGVAAGFGLFFALSGGI
jgi:hypothetical protein